MTLHHRILEVFMKRRSKEVMCNNMCWKIINNFEERLVKMFASFLFRYFLATLLNTNLCPSVPADKFGTPPQVYRKTKSAGFTPINFQLMMKRIHTNPILTFTLFVLCYNLYPNALRNKSE